MASIYDSASEWDASVIYNKNDYVKDQSVNIGGAGALLGMMVNALAFSRREHIYWYSIVDGNENSNPGLFNNNW